MKIEEDARDVDDFDVCSCPSDDRQCPYQAEVNDNDDDFCNCCDHCAQQCIGDI